MSAFLVLLIAVVAWFAGALCGVWLRSDDRKALARVREVADLIEARAEHYADTATDCTNEVDEASQRVAAIALVDAARRIRRALEGK